MTGKTLTRKTTGDLLAGVSVPDSLAGLDLWAPAFPSADLVRAAAALLTPSPLPDRRVTVVTTPRQTPSEAKGVELGFGDARLVERDRDGEAFALAGFDRGRVTAEGPRSYITVGPGLLRVSTFDPVRADRQSEAKQRRDRATADLAALRMAAGLEVDPETPGGRVIASWSAKSRANMVRVLNSLDYAPLLAAGPVPAMVTLTYPGDWLAVAPHAAASRRHFTMLRRRFERSYGVPMVAVWKREFQRRGAPHYHLHMAPPAPRVVPAARPAGFIGPMPGVSETFQTWLARTWVEVVNPSRIPDDPDTGSEWDRMTRVHLGPKVVDYAEGMRASDPRRLGVYFAKHGSFSAKEYQNAAPAEWVEAGSVGRFWGVMGVPKALATVEVTDAERVALARTLRRWSRHNSYAAPVRVWRSTAIADDGLDLGTDPARRWRKRTVRRRVKRMRGVAGFLTLNDAPAFLSQVAPHLDAVHLRATGEIRH